MRVIVDANPMFPLSAELGPTGVGRWTAGSISALAAAAPDWRIDLIAFHLRSARLDVTGMGPNVSFRLLRFSNRLSRQMNVLGIFPPVDSIVGAADAVVGPAYVPWRSRRAAEIPVIHDLTHLHFPQFVSSRNLRYLRMTIPRVLKRAARVVTVSDAMRREIVDAYRLNPEDVTVVPNGCESPRFGNPASTTREDLPETYLLFVGTLEPRKNLMGLLEACDLLRARRGSIPPLVVVGGAGWRTEGFEAVLAPRIQAGEVRMLGYVPDDDLPAIYQKALALVFPSHYEGFGLPVLEAMAAGCPVVASARGGIPEVAGEAALLTDPQPETLADAMAKIIQDERLRERLSELGRARAQSFTWEKSGAALKEAILQAVEHRRVIRER